MDRSIAFILSLSILIPLVIGLIRYKDIKASYSPLVCLLSLGFLSELVSYTLFYHSSNAIPTNIYFLLEFLLLSWQFRKWKNILKWNALYKTLLMGMTLLWFFENIFLGRIVIFSPVFQVSYSFVLILFAVNQLNWLLVNERGNILKSPVFIICIALILFFSYKVMAEIFYYYAPNHLIKNNIFVIESYLNVAYNIMLALAILCIPPKKTFIVPLR